MEIHMKRLSLFLATLLSLSIVSTVPVYARESNSGRDDSADSSMEQEIENEIENEIEKPDGLNEAQKQEIKARKEAARQFNKDKKDEVKARKAELKQKVEERKVEIKKDICEKRQENIQNAINNMAQNAPRILDRFNRVYDKVQAYKIEKNLAVQNYDALIAKVDTAKAQAAADVEVAQSQVVSIDCNSPGIGAQIDSARQAMKTARESLKAYRSSLKDLIKAVKTAAEAAETTEGSNDTQTQQ